MPSDCEIYRVEVFTEVISEHDGLDRAQTNIATRITAAGLRIEDVTWCVNYHPIAGVFVCLATVVSVAEPAHGAAAVAPSTRT